MPIYTAKTTRGDSAPLVQIMFPNGYLFYFLSGGTNGASGECATGYCGCSNIRSGEMGQIAQIRIHKMNKIV